MMLTSFLVLFQSPEAENPRRMFVANPKEAYYMEPPELVAKAFVKSMVWTDDGSTLLVERFVPPSTAPKLAIAQARQTDGLTGMLPLRPRLQIVAWVGRTRTARTLIDLDSARADIIALEPFPRSASALMTLMEKPLLPDGTAGPETITYLLIDSATGIAKRLWTEEAGTPLAHVMLSPKQPQGALLSGPKSGPQKIALFGVDGKLAAPLTLPLTQHFDFSDKGLPGVRMTVTGTDGKRRWDFRLIDPRTGALGASVTENDFGEGEPAPVLELVPIRSKDESTGIIIHSEKWRTKPGPIEESGIVTSDGSLPLLSPRLDAVAYLSGNSAFVRSIVKVDRSAYDLAMLDSEKAKAMRNAKQMATALSMYSGDYDDAFPLSGGDGKDVVLPYLKNRSILDSFTYTFAGGSAGNNPSQTELGYVAGPGGRAVVYADGSIRWLPDGV